MHAKPSSIVPRMQCKSLLATCAYQLLHSFKCHDTYCGTFEGAAHVHAHVQQMRRGRFAEETCLALGLRVHEPSWQLPAANWIACALSARCGSADVRPHVWC